MYVVVVYCSFRLQILLQTKAVNSRNLTSIVAVALTLLQWIVKWGFTEMLPNSHYNYVLRIFLTMSISVVSCECSFSN